MKPVQLTILSLSVVALVTSACGSKHQTTPVAPLAASTQSQVSQNLKNGKVPAPAEVATGTVKPAPNACETFRAKIPSDWTQDFLMVPEDPAQPNGTQIKIFYYGKISPGAMPMVFFNGGPMSDSHGSRSVMAPDEKFYDPKTLTSMIYIDQRGTGCSDSYPQGSTPDVLTRLSHYGSRGIVSDAEHVREKLFSSKRWIAFGQSYGGFIIHRYATTAPQGLKAAFSHANVISPNGYQRVLERIASQVRVGEIYLQQYPSDRQLLQTLKERLPESKCYTSEKNPKSKACGYAPLVKIASNLLGFTNQWSHIHEWINLMATPAGISDDGVARFLAAFYFSDADANPAYTTAWAGLVINYVDRSEPYLDAQTCTSIRTDLSKQGVDLNTSFANECLSTLQSEDQSHALGTDTFKDVRFLAQDKLLISDFVASLTANPAMSFYAYSGTKDPYVPMANFGPEVAAAKGLANFHYTNFSGTGHDGFYDEPQVWRDILVEAQK